MARAAGSDPVTSRELHSRSRSLVFELAGSSDDAELRDFLRRNPLPGWITLAYEREPDYFLGTTIEGDAHETILARERREGQLVGTYTRSLHQSFLNGRVESLGYLGLLRLAPQHRNRLAHLRDGFEVCRKYLHRDGRAAFYLTSIVESNRTARRVLTAGLPGLPTYRPLDVLSTLVLPCRRARAPGRSSVRIARASRADLGAVAGCLQRNYARYQCSPFWSEQDLRSEERCRNLSLDDFLLALRDDRVVGCAAIWDQRELKQHVVKAYAPRIARWRPAFNAIAPMLGLPRLPAVGEPLRQAYLSHVAVDDDDPAVLVSLVAAALRQGAERGLRLLTLGLSERNPMLPAVKRRFRHLQYRSLLYLVHWADGEDAVRGLDDRAAHVEAATL